MDDISPISRKDTQYTDIENFPEYQFRHNILYELAIRNKDVQNLTKDYILCWLKYGIYESMPVSTSDLKSCKKLAFSLSDEYIDPANLYLDYHFFEDENNNIKQREEEYHSRKSKEDEIETQPSLILLEHSNHDGEWTKSKHDKVFKTRVTKTDLFYKILANNETKEQTDREVTRHEIFPTYSRPSLVSFYRTAKLKINLDLNLPTKELQDFIQRLKNEHCKDNIPNITLSEVFDFDKSANIGYSYKAKRTADMLYVYDYVTHIKNEALEYNQRLKEELLELTLDKYDKARILNEASIYIQAKTIIKSTDHGNILLRELNSRSKGTIENHYNTINKLITNKSYKDLI